MTKKELLEENETLREALRRFREEIDELLADEELLEEEKEESE